MFLAAISDKRYADWRNHILVDDSYTTVNDITWGMRGGPLSVSLNISKGLNPDKLLSLLTQHVTVYNNHAFDIWHGYVHEISAVIGQTSVTLSMDNVYNRVSVMYTYNDGNTNIQAQTTWNEAWDSIEIYGAKEFITTLSDTTPSMADVQRDIILATHMNPMPVFGDGQEVVVTCYGYWKTLEWQYYGKDDTSLLDSILQLKDIFDYSQFARDVIIDDIVGQQSPQGKKFNETALKHATSVMNLGDDNGNHFVAEYLAGNKIHIHRLKDDGRILMPSGKVIRRDGFAVPDDEPIFGEILNLRGFNIPSLAGANRVTISECAIDDTGKRRLKILGSPSVMDFNTVGAG